MGKRIKDARFNNYKRFSLLNDYKKKDVKTQKEYVKKFSIIHKKVKEHLTKQVMMYTDSVETEMSARCGAKKFELNNWYWCFFAQKFKTKLDNLNDVKRKLQTTLRHLRIRLRSNLVAIKAKLVN